MPRKAMGYILTHPIVRELIKQTDRFFRPPLYEICPVSASPVPLFFINCVFLPISKTSVIWFNCSKEDMGIAVFHVNGLSVSGGAFPPEFAGPIKNLTVPLGRDATFTCLVKHLGGYRVSSHHENSSTDRRTNFLPHMADACIISYKFFYSL